MANLDDLLTVQKNGVVAVNALVQALDSFRTIYESFVGNNSTFGLSNDTLIATGSGRLVTVSVIISGTGGKIYDSSTVVGATDANAIYAIPNSVGATTVNFPFFSGLVIRPAAGSIISISYSEA
jgi:hypothetical protein